MMRNTRRNQRNQEALEFEWDPTDSRRYLSKGDNPHVHPKMAELVKRWYLQGDRHDDIERKSRNAARRMFRGPNAPELRDTRPPRDRSRQRHDSRNRNDRGERSGRNYRTGRTNSEKS